MTDLLFSIGNTVAAAGVVSPSSPTAPPAGGPDFSTILHRIADRIHNPDFSPNSSNPQNQAFSGLFASVNSVAVPGATGIPAAADTSQMAALLQRLSAGIPENAVAGDEKIQSLLSEIAAAWQETGKGAKPALSAEPSGVVSEPHVVLSEPEVQQLHDVLSVLASLLFSPAPAVPVQPAGEGGTTATEPLDSVDGIPQSALVIPAGAPNSTGEPVVQIESAHLPLQSDSTGVIVPADAVAAIGQPEVVSTGQPIEQSDAAVAAPTSIGQSPVAPVDNKAIGQPENSKAIGQPEKSSTDRPVATQNEKREGVSHQPTPTADDIPSLGEALAAAGKREHIFIGTNIASPPAPFTSENEPPVIDENMVAAPPIVPQKSVPEPSAPAAEHTSEAGRVVQPKPVSPFVNIGRPVAIPHHKAAVFNVDIPKVGTVTVRLRPTAGAMHAELVLPKGQQAADVLPALVEGLETAIRKAIAEGTDDGIRVTPSKNIDDSTAIGQGPVVEEMSDQQEVVQVPQPRETPVDKSTDSAPDLIIARPPVAGMEIHVDWVDNAQRTAVPQISSAKQSETPAAKNLTSQPEQPAHAIPPSAIPDAEVPPAPVVATSTHRENLPGDSVKLSGTNIPAVRTPLFSEIAGKVEIASIALFAPVPEERPDGEITTEPAPAPEPVADGLPPVIRHKAESSAEQKVMHIPQATSSAPSQPIIAEAAQLPMQETPLMKIQVVRENDTVRFIVDNSADVPGKKGDVVSVPEVKSALPVAENMPEQTVVTVPAIAEEIGPALPKEAVPAFHQFADNNAFDGKNGVVSHERVIQPQYSSVANDKEAASYVSAPVQKQVGAQSNLFPSGRMDTATPPTHDEPAVVAQPPAHRPMVEGQQSEIHNFTKSETGHTARPLQQQMPIKSETGHTVRPLQQHTPLQAEAAVFAEQPEPAKDFVHRQPLSPSAATIEHSRDIPPAPVVDTAAANKDVKQPDVSTAGSTFVPVQPKAAEVGQVNTVADQPIRMEIQAQSVPDIPKSISRNATEPEQATNKAAHATPVFATISESEEPHVSDIPQRTSQRVFPEEMAAPTPVVAKDKNRPVMEPTPSQQTETDRAAKFPAQDIRAKEPEKAVSVLISDEEEHVAYSRPAVMQSTAQPTAAPHNSAEKPEEVVPSYISSKPETVPAEEPEIVPAKETGVDARIAPAASSQAAGAHRENSVVPAPLPVAQPAPEFSPAGQMLRIDNQESATPAIPLSAEPDNTGTLIEEATDVVQAVPVANDEAVAASPAEKPEQRAALSHNEAAQNRNPATGMRQSSVEQNNELRTVSAEREPVVQEQKPEVPARPEVVDRKADIPAPRVAVPVRGNIATPSGVEPPAEPAIPLPVQSNELLDRATQPENIIRTGKVVHLADRSFEHPRTTAGRLTAQRMGSAEFAASPTVAAGAKTIPLVAADRGGNQQQNTNREQPFVQMPSLPNAPSAPEASEEVKKTFAVAENTADGQAQAPDKPQHESAVAESRVVYLPFHGVRNGMPPVRTYKQIVPADIPRTVQNAMRTFPSGGGLVHMTLAPEALGEVIVAISVKDRQTEVSIHTETPDARRMVEAQLPALKEKLVQVGLQVEHIEVRTKQQDIVQNDPRSWKQGGQTHEDQKSRQEFVRSFRHLASDDQREPAVILPPRQRSGNGYFERYA